VDERLKLIAEADVLAFGPVGFAGAVLPVTQAYYDVAEALERDGEALRPRLERLLDTATPAGRLYAADLLYQLDPAAGRQAWHRLVGDGTEVRTFSGCVMGQTTVGEYAGEQAQ
jgi:hypothetical protein